MDADEERALVRRAQRGDVSAFEALISDHVPSVRRLARAFTSDREDAAELAQEALLKAYLSLGRLGRRSSFSTWLYEVVRDVYLDHSRGLDGLRAAELSPAAMLTGGRFSPCFEMWLARQLLERDELQAFVWWAIQRVPAELRAILVLHDVEGLSREEIAAVEKAPLDEVMERLSRGRDHLRRALASGAPQLRSGA